MTRVSENSMSATVARSLDRTKSRIDDLRRKGAVLKEVTRPSEGPVRSVEALRVSTALLDNRQYLRNADHAMLALTTSDKALERLTGILQKAKEIAVSQSSDLHGADVRRGVVEEVVQMRHEALAVANARMGRRYVFAGRRSLTRPFGPDGAYQGDEGRIEVEVARGLSVPVNLHGREVFAPSPGDGGVFGTLDALARALVENDTRAVQAVLEPLDAEANRIITLRARVGSVADTVRKTGEGLKTDNVFKEERRGALVDADVARLFSDITRHQDVLEASYRSSRAALDQNLFDFIR